MSKQTIYSAIKWLFVLAAFSYLAYKLITFDQYDEFIEQWRNTPLNRFWWLVIVFLLLPANFSLESLKWKLLTANVQQLGFSGALKGVLAGITTGFFTPNRIGDMIGRITYLQPGKRVPGITLSLLNSFTQNLTIVLCGVPAIILFIFNRDHVQQSLMLYAGLCFIVLLSFGTFYFFLPVFSKKLVSTRFGKKIADFIACLSDYSMQELLGIILVSLLRYAVFSTQFFCMLHFFGVELSIWQALISIPAYYLLITFTPSLAFSEAAIRASYAMIFIGAFSGQTINIALAGVAIWFVNWVIPLCIGSVVLLKSKA